MNNLSFSSINNTEIIEDDSYSKERRLSIISNGISSIRNLSNYSNISASFENLSLKNSDIIDKNINDNDNKLLKYLDTHKIYHINSDFLRNHDIDANARAKILDWLSMALSKFKNTEKIFFHAIYILDEYLRKSNSIKINDIQLIVLVCIFISKKKIKDSQITFNIIIDKIGKGKFKGDNIFDTEIEIFQVLKNRIFRNNIYDNINNCIFYFEIQKKLDNDNFIFFNSIIRYLLIIIIIDYDMYSTTSMKEIVGIVISLALKLMENIDKSIDPKYYAGLIIKSLNLNGKEFVSKIKDLHKLSIEFKSKYNFLKFIHKIINKI